MNSSIAFERERRHLLSVAFRILGSQHDAEDAVQEAWIRYSTTGTREVRNVAAWLTTIVARLCLDTLRRRREVPQEDTQLLEGTLDEPGELALLADELTAAFAVVLHELTPPQRVALVLHDAFGVPFEDIAHILGTTEGSAKKLASRARGRVRERTSAPAESPAQAREVVEAFLRAAREGDTHALIALLDPNVFRLADPQVLRPGAQQRITGAAAVASEAATFRTLAEGARVALIDDRPGIVIAENGGARVALILRVQHGRVVHYEVIGDPYRIAQLEIKA